jgi:hypothetical protein
MAPLFTQLETLLPSQSCLSIANRATSLASFVVLLTGHNTTCISSNAKVVSSKAFFLRMTYRLFHQKLQVNTSALLR